MAESREIILQAAEDMAREQGVKALSVRQLARETNYSKTNVHLVIDGVPNLIAELRDRAVAELLEAFKAPPQISSTHPDACSLIPNRIADWILENPAWAEVAFVSTDSDPDDDWTHPIGDLLRDAFPAEIARLTDHELAVVAARGARMILADMPAVIELGPDYGRHILTTTVSSIYSGVDALISKPA